MTGDMSEELACAEEGEQGRGVTRKKAEDSTAKVDVDSKRGLLLAQSGNIMMLKVLMLEMVHWRNRLHSGFYN
jgi:hypothetical protein